MTHRDDLGAKALSGLIWSLAQSWGGKALNLLLYLVLARLLSPAEFGIAAAVGLVLLLQSVVAEFGFGDAIVQRRELAREDVSLPFYVAMSVSIAIAVGVALASPWIERWMNLPGLAPYLTVAALFSPASTAAAMQQAMYKRELDFMPLAMRQFVALVLSGIAGVACALSGLGAWSLIVQAVVATVVGAIWLWRRPHWLPTRKVNRRSFGEIARFGSSLVATRLVDFGATRAVDLVIAGLHGAAALGLYTVGSKLYQTAMELLCRAVMDVTLSTLSRIAHETERLVASYGRVIALNSLVGVPVFLLAAALSPEITHILFGAKWAGSETVMRALMLIGSIQCVQFVNGPYLTAMGRPHVILGLTLIKLAAVMSAIIFIPSRDVTNLVEIYVMALLVVTPFSFGAVMHVLKIRTGFVLRILALPYFGAALGYGAVLLARAHLAAYLPGEVMRVCALGVLFAIIYAAVMVVGDRPRLGMLVGLVRKRA